jgi:hypothetical protein
MKSPIAETSAQIIRNITSTAAKKTSLIQLLLDLVNPAVKGEYGKEGWPFGTATKVAAKSSVDISNAIGVYGFDFDKVDQLGWSEDYYVGQSLGPMKLRWSAHLRFFKMSTARLEEAWPKSKKVPVLYRNGHRRTEKQIGCCVLADLSRFDEDQIMSSILATIFEAAFCIFFGSFQINNYDNSWAAGFARWARPPNLPIVPFEGLNHAFPLSQFLRLNAWTRMERQILVTVQATPMNPRSINIKCQE